MPMCSNFSPTASSKARISLKKREWVLWLALTGWELSYWDMLLKDAPSWSWREGARPEGLEVWIASTASAPRRSSIYAGGGLDHYLVRQRRRPGVSGLREAGWCRGRRGDAGASHGGVSSFLRRQQIEWGAHIWVGRAFLAVRVKEQGGVVWKCWWEVAGWAWIAESGVRWGTGSSCRWVIEEGEKKGNSCKS